ncbi:uncharacterized protein LOC123872625 [Maniola jurtina]|uniref:uncharacterized protein LOC123872625 n=1 Tax=Maniola jurtina TaxID=191418 RepID=UPI001E688DFC|nr:uncharacterized protein LOC123872625 [Maniola jurtina]
MPAVEGEDILAVTFIPDEFKVGGHSTVDIVLSCSRVLCEQVVLEARRASARRAWLREARVAHAHRPLYLLIDAAISGVEVTVEFPIGGDENTDSFVKIPMTQPERPCSTTLDRLSTPEEMFAQDDRKRALQKENICQCHYEMIYIPPPPPPAPPEPPGEERGGEEPVSILEEPPALTRVCGCARLARPLLPQHSEPYCLQFRDLPVRTVRSRTLVLHNASRLEASWRAAVRRWPRTHARTVDREQWAGDVHCSGVVLDVRARGGRLAARRSVAVRVSAYAACWGLYRDQLLIQVEGLSPLVLDVWVQAVGAPLQFPLRPAPRTAHPPALWMSYSDPDRVVRVTNTSRADLTTDVYLVREHEYPQDELPLRLYLRFVDLPPRLCACVTAFESNTKLKDELTDGAVCSDMDTGVELFLAPDHGVQSTDGFYQVEPQQLRVRAGQSAALRVRLQRRLQLAPPHALLLRSAPRPSAGRGWCRPPPPPQLLRLRQAPREPQLQLLCSELRVVLCALDLPDHDILRVRKKFRIQNIGEGPLEAVAATEAPWRVEVSRDVCDAHCVRLDRNYQFEDLKLKIPPRSSLELFAEVSVRTEDAWPARGAAYPPRLVTTTALNFYDHDNVLLLSSPLTLELERPALRAQPAELDFGLVSDGSTRKAYFTVSHSSLSTLELVTQWSGDGQFRLHPPALSLPGGARARVYVQYTARWVSDRSSEGSACVCACGAAGAWCRVALRVTARATRQRALHAAPHADHTDDVHLLPRDSC